MAQHKCAFSHTLLQEQFRCENAKPITRREGPDVCCTSATAYTQCAALLQRMKEAALPAFGVSDDPLQMPHSVLVKIQFGGLLGLQRLVDGVTEQRVDNIHALVERSTSRYGQLTALPYPDLTSHMTGYKIKRRRGR